MQERRKIERKGARYLDGYDWHTDDSTDSDSDLDSDSEVKTSVGKSPEKDEQIRILMPNKSAITWVSGDNVLADNLILEQDVNAVIETAVARDSDGYSTDYDSESDSDKLSLSVQERGPAKSARCNFFKYSNITNILPDMDCNFKAYNPQELKEHIGK